MIVKGSEDWELMSDFYKLYAKAVDCKNPSITTKNQWYAVMEADLKAFIEKYYKTRPIAYDLAEAIVKDISLTTVND